MLHKLTLFISRFYASFVTRARVRARATSRRQSEPRVRALIYVYTKSFTGFLLRRSSQKILNPICHSSHLYFYLRLYLVLKYDMNNQLQKISAICNKCICIKLYTIRKFFLQFLLIKTVRFNSTTFLIYF